MTKDDIIKMAACAGLWVDGNQSGSDSLEHFARLVAAAEREACAEICKPQERWDDPLTAYEIAQAIRARS